MDLDNLDSVLSNEPSYRKKQVMSFIFKNLIEDFSDALSLPKGLRETLKQECSLSINSEEFVSDDESTVKIVITLKDGAKIESVLMRHKEGRNTVCVSSQVGCPVGCKFCATGKMGFKRNLSYFEIIEQVLFFARYLKKEDDHVTNVVFMGMGEPLLNYDNVLKSIRTLNDKDLFNIGARHISISTSGIIDGIKKLSEENLQIKLAISLHAPNDKIRSSLMPINNQYSIETVFNALEDYFEKTKRRIMVEYLLIDGINDSEENAKELSKFVKSPRYFVNLISYNPTGEFKPSPSNKIKRFKEVLEDNGIEVSQRYRFGRGIKAACGQLGSL